MYGCSLASGLPVNAEVDSMGGVVEVGDVVGTRISPRRAAIEKVQAELRQEYDVREERKRELEFLEKGGNPLDFKFGNAASASVQSTSLTDRHPDLFVTSEAKSSIAFTASTHGDSVESSGRPGAQSVCEPVSADNLMLFDGENDSIEGDRISGRLNGSNVAVTDHSFSLVGSHKTKDIGDAGPVGLPRIAYNRRRYRSRPSRHAAPSSSSDVVLAHCINGSSLHSFGGPRDLKGLVCHRGQGDQGQDQKVSSNGPVSHVCTPVCQTAPSAAPMDLTLDILHVVESANDSSKHDPADDVKDYDAVKSLPDDRHDLDSLCSLHKYARRQSLEEPYSYRAPEERVIEGLEFLPAVPVVQTHVSSVQMNGSGSGNVDVKSTPNSSRTNNITLDSNTLESVPSCTQTRLSLDRNNDTDMCINGRCVDTSGDIKELASAFGGDGSVLADHVMEKNNEIKANENDELVIEECGFLQQSLKENGFVLKAKEESNTEVSGLQNETENQTQDVLKDRAMVESMDVDICGVSETGRVTSVPFGDNLNAKDDNSCKMECEGSSSPSIVKLPKQEPLAGVSNSACVVQASSVTDLKASRVDEDSILEEARILEAKRKRIAQLSLSKASLDSHGKSQWDYVLEEMAWLANDFAQERLWKRFAASQVGNQVSLSSRLRYHEQTSLLEGQKKARFVARAVMEFWHSLEGKNQRQELICRDRGYSPALQEYGLRFQKNNTFNVGQVEAPIIPDRISDVGIMEVSSDNRSKEENVFYVVPLGAMERYRNFVESCLAKYEKTGSSVPEEFETSTSDAVADNAYGEDEGETSTYDLDVAVDSSKSSKYPRKKLKNSMTAHSARKLGVAADSPFIQCADNKAGSQQPVLVAKRPANSLNVSFPTKRVRSSNRHRVLSPFTAGTSAHVQGPTKTDASSGDTNSFQDDQSTLDGASHALNNLEVESGGDIDKHLGYESAEVSIHTKKKKARHSGSACVQRWQVDSNFQVDQSLKAVASAAFEAKTLKRYHSRKRLESHQFESNGSSGLFGNHIAKKPKMIRQSLDNATDSSAHHGGSAPSPVASQISNPNKFIKHFGGRDRSRKTKLIKIPASQPGPGCPWSLFEEQALVVLVHDLGPNWELVSDAINSTLQFKCIFRNPKECKERHKHLMDRTSGDGADSAEDSGSSHPYSSTLPGIPKGSARQLFQRLQGPMEEDMLKSHFEKIIMIGQKLHCRRKQEPKQIQPPHGSHMVALSQVYPNNLNGGPILTPLDLCDATASSSDVLPLCHPGTHSAVLPTSNQGMMTPQLIASGGNSPVLGSSNMTTSDNFASSPVPVNASLRDARYAVLRSASLTTEETRRQQYNQMLSGRNIPQLNLSSSGPVPANDRSVRMVPGGSGVAITGGGNQTLPIAKPGFQGITSSSMLNAGNINSSGMVAMPSPVNVRAGISCGQGNSSRAREALHMMRPTQNQDPPCQMMVPELQMQASQGSNQGISAYAGISSSFPNQVASPLVPSFSLHHQHSQTSSPQQLQSISPRHPHVQGNTHSLDPQHPAYSMRLAKDRQMQQRRLQQQMQPQQQQHFPSSNSLMSHVQSQAQLPVSSPLQNSSQVSSQTTAPPVSLSPLTPGSPMTVAPQHQHQHQMMPHGFPQNAQTANNSMTNQTGKQRQCQAQQQFPQSGRHHPQQREQAQSQRRAKVLKGPGRGNTMHQNMVTEPSGLNSLSVNPGNLFVENGEPPMHLLQDQGIFSSSAMNPIPAGRPLARQSSNQSQPVQRMFAGQASSISKHLQQVPCNSDFVNQGQASPVSSGPLSTGQQSISSMVMAGSGHQQPQLQGCPKLVNQSQLSVQRVPHQNHHLNTELTNLLGREPQNDQVLMARSSRMGSTATSSQAGNDVTNVSKGISPAGATPWRGSELLYDSGTSSPAAHLGTSGSLSSSASSETSSQVGQGPNERHSFDNSPAGAHDFSTQWQQKRAHFQPSSHVFQQLQQQQQSLQQQMLPLSVSQPQTQLTGSIYVRPPDSVPE